MEIFFYYEPETGSDLPYVTSLYIKMRTQSTFLEGKFHVEAALVRTWEAMVRSWRALEGGGCQVNMPPCAVWSRTHPEGIYCC